MSTSVRTADPYGDLDVIDARAPRFNQATVGIVSLIAVLSGWWPLLALLAAQLAIGLRFGRQFCLACLVYFEVVQPRIGEGPIEDSRPPRFANVVGLVVLGAASVAYLVGLTAAGAALGLLVAALALLAALTGFCTGCWIYRLAARWRGISTHTLSRVAAADLGLASLPEALVVVFGHPLCTDCRALERSLRSEGRRFASVDVRERRDLAHKYGVAVVPTAVEVAADGSVTRRLAG